MVENTLEQELYKLYERNKQLFEALKIAEFYVKTYINMEDGHGEDVTPLKEHLKQIQEALNGKIKYPEIRIKNHKE